jgi:hypothetical protein
MSHWAEIDENNLVIRTTVGDNNDPAGDEGYQWLIDNLGGTWLKTSYNAMGGKWRNPASNELTNNPGFRKNYAAVGYTYNEALDAFIAPKPFESWILDEETCLWEPPVEQPQNIEGYVWEWLEDSQQWNQVEKPDIPE